MNIAIVSFTSQGAEIVNRIIHNTDDIFYTYKKGQQPLGQWVAHMFEICNALIFVGAAGIAVRLIKDCIVSKERDPAVIVVDELGKFTVPILSGHLGGANALALKISNCINSTPVITTATDLNNKFAVDLWAKENNCVIDDIGTIKHISAAVLENEKVGFYSDFPVEGELPDSLEISRQGDLGICVSTDTTKKPFAVTLNVIPKIVTLGVGSRRDIDFKVFESAIVDILERSKVSVKSISAVTSIELKKDEPSILMFAEKYDIPFVTYSAERLNALLGNFTASEFVKNTAGVDNVCERSAVLNSKGRLILGKTTQNGVAAALAIGQWRCRF